jgi:hypothetical protein
MISDLTRHGNRPATLYRPAKKNSAYQVISSVGENMLYPYCSFSLLAQRKRTKRKGTLCPLSSRRRDTLCSSMLPGLCKLATIKQCKSLFDSLSGARLLANGILTAYEKTKLY